MKNKIYESSGVSLENGYETVRRIKSHVKRTNVPGVMSSIGGFGAMFDMKEAGFKDPILVSGTDGVGTKLIIAIQANKHDTIGQDLVAMCVNDVLTLGARPVYFLDYFATGKLNPEIAEQVVKGIADGLVLSGAALVGGETAEMPDMYEDGHYDLGGFVVAGVERDQVIDSKKNIKEDDVIIAIPSSGIHSNGFSLVRKIFFKDHQMNLSDKVPYSENTLADELLVPTKIYVKPILNLLAGVNVNGLANITGGGFYENIPRMFTDELTFDVDYSKVKVLPIFKWMQELSGASDEEMFSTFNMGVGMVAVVSPEEADKAIKVLKENNEDAYIIGKVVKK